MAFDLKINKSKNHRYPKSKEELGSYVKTCHDSGLNNRRGHEFQWAVNYSYYLGFQNLHYSPLTGTINRDIESENIIINRIAPYVEIRNAKYTRNKPLPYVVPDKNNRESIQGAKISEMLLKHLWKTDNMDEKHATFCTNINTFGTCFLKDIWNPGIGQKMDITPDDGVLRMTEDGEDEVNLVFTGEAETHVKSPWAILANPGATNLDDAIWIIDRSHMTVRQIMETYPHLEMDKIPLGTEMTVYERFVNRLQSPMFSIFSGVEQAREMDPVILDHELVLVKEMWLRPNEIYPDGAVLTVIGSELIDMQAFPKGFTEYPFARAVEKEQLFSFYGQCTVTRLIPAQNRYNQARTQVAKNAAINANIKWHVFKGSGLHEDSLTDEEGEIVETNPNVGRPEQLQVAPLPNYVMESQVQDLKDFREMSGEREASEVPGLPQVTAGVALETVAEISDTILAPTIKSIEKAFVKSQRHKLIYANNNYDDPRIIKIVDQDNQVMVKEFRKEDLANQTDVTIRIESSLGNSKAAQQQKLLDMWDRRIIVDPQLFLDAWHSGRIDTIMSHHDKMNNVIAEDIEAIKNGQQPPVNPFDNHVVYIAKLSEFIQSPEFRRMPPDRQQIALMSLQQHLQMIQPQQQQAPNPAAVGTPNGAQVTEGAV